ncbi:hypothetical protein O0I10_004497 [Lichtheimia ornata]|uniref:Rad21/Rec8-like protein N-terminal domain-containing protein n=1 Tax=Lichtheimia ornata TaxID=688661 RepID=A0AAD7V5T6_9FUNG|nr:uncharacterized protein O0I10_004497 [Lichtheimia ornata]KAJ8659904.1 hypothetical protein O0I10_004497 [Lichtheimia ornata]
MLNLPRDPVCGYLLDKPLGLVVSGGLLLGIVKIMQQQSSLVYTEVMQLWSRLRFDLGGKVADPEIDMHVPRAKARNITLTELEDLQLDFDADWEPIDLTDHLLEDARISSQIEEQQQDGYQEEDQDQVLAMEVENREEQENAPMLSDVYDDMFFDDDFNYGFDPMQRNDINADVAIVPEDAVSETDTQGYSQIVPLSPTASDTSSQMQSIQHRRPRQRRRRSTRIATTDPVTILPATFYGRTADITTTRPMQTSRKRGTSSTSLLAPLVPVHGIPGSHIIWQRPTWRGLSTEAPREVEMARRGSRQGGMSVSSGQLFSSSGNISVNDWMDGIPVVPDATITSGLGAGAAASGSSGQNSSSGEHWTDIDDDLFLDDINVGSMHDDDPDALLSYARLFAQNQDRVALADLLVSSSTKSHVARSFYNVLVLATQQKVKPQQSTPYGAIHIILV